MKQKIVIGNWKNYLNESETIKLAKEILDEKFSDNIRLMISPCNLYLNQVNQIMKGSSVEVIGQNITVGIENDARPDIFNGILSALQVLNKPVPDRRVPGF